jgi:hypothetical protein
LVILTRAEHARLHFAGKTVKRWSDAERVRAQTLYDAGLTVDEVAVALARPYESTRETLQRRGCTRTPAETRKLRQKQFAQFREAAQLSPRIVDQLITASPSESSDSSTHHARTGSASAQPA